MMPVPADCPVVTAGRFSIHCCRNGTLVSSDSSRAFSRRLHSLCRSLVTSQIDIDLVQPDTQTNPIFVVLVLLIPLLCLLYVVCRYYRCNRSSTE